MGFFSRKDKVIDLSEDYHTDRKALEMIKARHAQQSSQSIQPKPSSEVSDGLLFLGNFPSSNTTVEDAFDSSLNVEDRKKKLAKRLADMTNRIEDLSNQLYHLQQRVELLERKSNIQL